MKRHRRAPGRTFDFRDRELSLAVGLPAYGLIRRKIRTPRFYDDSIGNDERRIESDAKLADELGVFALVAGHPVEKLGGARARDRAQVIDQFVPRHADAVVHDGQRFRLRVMIDNDREVGIAL